MATFGNLKIPSTDFVNFVKEMDNISVDNFKNIAISTNVKCQSLKNYHMLLFIRIFRKIVFIQKQAFYFTFNILFELFIYIFSFDTLNNWQLQNLKIGADLPAKWRPAFQRTKEFPRVSLLGPIYRLIFSGWGMSLSALNEPALVRYYSVRALLIM